MANRHRGEIDAVLDGTPYRLCLTLGALAELESAFDNDDMLALAERFSSGRVSARDAIRIIGAGLRGAGHPISDDDVSRMRADDAATGYVTIVGRLLAATFTPGDPANPAAPAAASPARLGRHDRRPFPWAEVMATGLGLLGISPRDFWAMTPREYAAAVRGRLGPRPAESALRRIDLDALMHRFPDT